VTHTGCIVLVEALVDGAFLALVSYRAASKIQMVVQKDHAELILLSRWFCNPLIKNPMVEPQCSKHGWAAFASPLPLQKVT